MQALIRAPLAPRFFTLAALAGVVIFALAVGVLMQPAATIIGQERLPELVCLQLAFTPARAGSILLAFDPAARAAIPGLLFPGVFSLAFGYGLVLFGLLGLLAMRLPGKWLRAGAVFIWMPLLATLFDCIENLFLYAITGQVIADPFVSVAPVLPLLGGAASVIKWIALCVLTPAYGFAGIVRGAALDRRPSSWVVYVLLFVVLLSMVAKPLQDIPNCF